MKSTKLNHLWRLLLTTVSCLLTTFFTVSCLLTPRPLRAQFIGYSSPQSVQQNLFPANTACTGAAQLQTINDRGQTQHLLVVQQQTTAAQLETHLEGSNDGVNFLRISDQSNFQGLVTASGWYPVVRASITCSPGTSTFSAFYSGTSGNVQPAVGDLLRTVIQKELSASNVASAGTTVTYAVVPPFGNLQGYLWVDFQGGAGPANSTISVACITPVGNSSNQTQTFNLATAAGAQIFPISFILCASASIVYTAGGANANTIGIVYNFTPPGSGLPSATASTLTAPLNTQPALTEKGARWSNVSAPAVSTKASAVQAAGAAGVRHVCDCVSISAGASTAPAATQLTINLRDGATGAGTVIWSTEITAAATATNHGNVNLCGLNLIGSAATAMTLEFSALLANEFEAVTLTGYDVQ